jgi:hypothetical protein
MNSTETKHNELRYLTAGKTGHYRTGSKGTMRSS